VYNFPDLFRLEITRRENINLHRPAGDVFSCRRSELRAAIFFVAPGGEKISTRSAFSPLSDDENLAMLQLQREETI
jgi:hypothetical protein